MRRALPLALVLLAGCSDASENLPAGSFGVYAVVDDGTPTPHWDPMEPEERLAATPELTDADVVKVEEATDEFTGAPQLVVHFTDAGATRFADFTAARVNQKIALVVDGRVVSAPIVRERIPGGRAWLSVQPGQLGAVRAALGFED